MGWNERVVEALEALADVSELATAANQATANAALAAIQAAVLGTGLPIPLAVSDPGSNDYSAALDPNPIDRACSRIRIIVGDSGVVVSLDGGVTDSIKVPANYADDLAVSIPSGADVRVKRLTTDASMTDLVVEVR